MLRSAPAVAGADRAGPTGTRRWQGTTGHIEGGRTAPGRSSAGRRGAGLVRSTHSLDGLSRPACGATVADLESGPSLEWSATSRLVLEPLCIEHATEVARASDGAELVTYLGGEPANAQQLEVRHRHPVVGQSADGRQRGCTWVLRSRADNEGAGCVRATVESDPVGASAGGASLVAELARVVGVRHQGRGQAREAVALVTWLPPAGASGRS